MSKRNIIFLITTIFIIIFIIILGLAYFGGNKTTPAPTDTTNNDNGIFNWVFTPFKSKPATTSPTTPADVSGYVPPPEPTIPKIMLKKVSSMPVAGFGIFMKEIFKNIPAPAPTPEQGINSTIGNNTNTKTPTTISPPLTEFVPAVRYAARATGNIYQTFADNIIERKFSTTIIPSVYEAYFGNNGESVIMRYLKTDGKTIETFVGILPKEYLGADSIGTEEIKGLFLPDNIRDISMSPDFSRMFYLFNSGNSIIGTTSGAAGDQKVQVFDSPFTEWLSFWPNNKIITITTKPSSGVPGFMYAIDPDKKDFNKILGNINGLTTLMSPDGKLVLYNNNDLSMNIFHTDTGATDPVGVKTLPEKCVWGHASDILYCAVPKFVSGTSYPDAWYKGQISFSDSIWRIDINTGSSTMISDPTTIAGGEDIDGIKLALDEGENYLFFVNKKDSFLWELGLK